MTLDVEPEWDFATLEFIVLLFSALFVTFFRRFSLNDRARVERKILSALRRIIGFNLSPGSQLSCPT
jgi:hypothetical protein